MDTDLKNCEIIDLLKVLVGNMSHDLDVRGVDGARVTINLNQIVPPARWRKLSGYLKHDSEGFYVIHDNRSGGDLSDAPDPLPHQRFNPHRVWLIKRANKKFGGVLWKRERS